MPDYDGDSSTSDDCQPLDPAIHPGAPDSPDLAFEDTNCDGIDGDAAQAVFTSAPGQQQRHWLEVRTRSKTIAAAIVKAKAEGKDVYASGGTYNEHVALATNVGIYGGYAPLTGARSAD